MASDVGCLKQPIKYILKIFKKVLTNEQIDVKISTSKKERKSQTPEGEQK